jgi:hypothetical protein
MLAPRACSHGWARPEPSPGSPPIVLADSLLPITTITALGALVFGFVGWRATKHGNPREATNFVATALAVVLAVLWLFLLGSLLLRLV